MAGGGGPPWSAALRESHTKCIPLSFSSPCISSSLLSISSSFSFCCSMHSVCTVCMAVRYLSWCPANQLCMPWSPATKSMRMYSTSVRRVASPTHAPPAHALNRSAAYSYIHPRGVTLRSAVRQGISFSYVHIHEMPRTSHRRVSHLTLPPGPMIRPRMNIAGLPLLPSLT